MFRTALLLVFTVCGAVHSQNLVNGKCPKLKDIPRLVPSQNLTRRTLFGRCSFNNYIFDSEDGLSMLYLATDTGKDLYSYYMQIHNESNVEVRMGTADLTDEVFQKTNVANTKFNQIRGGLQDVTIPMMLIASDDQNYAVFYSCRETVGPKKLEMALAYTTVMKDNSHDEEIKEAVEKVGLDYSRLTFYDQDD